MDDSQYYEIKQFKDLKSATFGTVELYNMSKDMVAGIGRNTFGKGRRK